MAYASISGLASGMDTASIISQLMQLEALPQTRLQSRVSAQERQVNALQTLNAKMAAIATQAANLAQASSWTPMKATSSSEHVTVKTSDAARATSLTFTVDQLAGSHQVSHASAVRLTDVVAPSGTVTLDKLDGTTPLAINVGDGSLDSVVKAINAAGAGVQASTVKADPVDVDGDGTLDQVYRLRLFSTTTGATSDFALGGLDSTVIGAAATTAGRDAKITIGDGAAAVQTSSATNTFTGVAPGVDVTLGGVTPLNLPVTVTVTRDTQSLSDKVKGLIDAANVALDEIGTLSGYDAATQKAGLLAGDSTLRKLRNELLSSVTSGLDGTSLASVGIEVDRAGKLVFDETAFKEAYAADPAGIATKFTGTLSFTDRDPADGATGTVELHQATWRTNPGTYTVDATGTGGTIGGDPATRSGSILTGSPGTAAEGLSLIVNGDVAGSVVYTQGFAGRLEALAQRASDKYDGTLTIAVKNRNSSISRLNDSIESWDDRLALRRATLERQFSGLEVALSNLQNQGNWLAGQLAGLPKWSS